MTPAVTPLPLGSPLEAYQQQAARLLELHTAGLGEGEIRDAPFDLEDAQLTLARCYSFLDWPALAGHVQAVEQRDSPVSRFEHAVDAVITGDLPALRRMLASHPELIGARSSRITPFDPPVHRAMLLHYVAANGVEGHRQKTPPNAVEVARALLEAGAEVDALADLYGGQCTTLSLLVSSCHPAQAGLQVALTETLLDFGAAVDGAGSGHWVSPIKTALVFGYREAAETLARRGARVDDLSIAAGLGDVDAAAMLLPAADAATRHSALALAAQLGHAPLVSLLLDAGEDPDRYNPPGHHAHSTPLHQAALAGHEAVVRLLVARGARLDIKDKLWHSTPAGWAAHSGQHVVEAFLRSAAKPSSR